MKKNLIIFLLLLLTASYVFALPVTKADANRVARNFIMERMGSNYSISETIALDSGYPSPYIYVINVKPSGFVLIAADNAATPIIGYSTENTWNEYEIPIQLQDMLKNWNDQMHAIVTQSMSADASISQLWSRYNVDTSRFTPNRSFRDVSPLITSTWGQGTYYNSLCPASTPVGCVATAMSQIMRFWRYPAVGSGTKTYTHPSYGVQTANFGSTTYNWGGMPNSVSSTNSSVATLCYQAGVSVEMDYDPAGSGAYSEDVPNALITYFRYNSSASLKTRSSYSESNWDALMKGEIDNGRPIYYGGSGNAGGHAFIVDGYTGTNLFHLNWGWDGWYNGNFTLANLNPGGDTFNNYQQAVIGIQPGVSSTTLSEGFEGATFPPTGWTNSGFSRSTTNKITGTYSARYNATATGTTQSGKQLRTSKLSVNATSPALTFKARAGTTARSEKIKVGYSTTGAAPYTYFGTQTSLTNAALTFTYATNGLTPGDYYFVFETYCSLTTSASRTWIIDEVTGPDLGPIASLNISSWAAGSVSPGDAVYSGDTFQLSNTAGGALTITSITNLSASPYKTNLNPGISLVAGQVHEFGFSFDPISYGVANQSFVITTNGGTLTITLTGGALSTVFSDSFESYSDFATTFTPWTTYNGDAGTPGGIDGVTIPNWSTMNSWMVFNPATTTPAVGAAAAHIGSKYAMSMYNNSAVPNNDWMITPTLSLGGSPTLSFWAMSYSSTYLETFKVYYSTTSSAAPTGFTLHATVASVPNAWTYYTYSLPACADQATVRLAIVNASTDQFMLFVDDVVVNDNSSAGTIYFGNINGYVYRSGTTEPIVGAKLTAGTKIAYSDANGFYQFNNMLVGTHSISVDATGQFYFPASASGVVVTDGNTTSQNLFLTWAEITVSPTSLSSNLYSGETEDINFAISNPGGTADLEYELWLTASTRGNNRTNTQFSKKPPLSPDTRRIETLPLQQESDRGAGWMGYTDIAAPDTYYNSNVALREKATKFTLEDFGLWSNGVTISKLRAKFYNPGTTEDWGTATNFYFIIYGASGTGTPLYTSPTYTATALVNMECVLATPLVMTTDFWVSVYCVTDGGKPHLLGSTASNGNSYYGASSAEWTAVTDLDWCIDAYAVGDEWVRAGSYAGTVAPAATVNTNMHFDSANLSAGTKNAYMYIFNNANYNSPSTQRGDYMVIPVSLTVTIPIAPTVTLNTNSWTTIAATGNPSSSGAVYTIKNVGMGTLTITSVSGLTGTPFSSSINTAITLDANQTHDFGFTFTPAANGIFTTTFTIVTNGGTKTVSLKGYANYIAESFEAVSFPPDGWTSQDVDGDTYNWMQYATAGTAHTGANSAASASYVNDTKSAQQSHSSSSRGTLTPNNWLITPRLTISTGDELSYWIAAQDPLWPAENYSVKLSTTNNQIASFTNTLFTETLTSGDWQNHVLPLNTYAGESVYIAFQHHACTDQFVLKLDDVLMPPFAAPLVFGNISGIVYKYGTFTPIVGATVSVAGRSIATDALGAYTISNIVSDVYPLTASATGYIIYSEDVTIPVNSTLNKNIFLSYAEVYTANTSFNTDITLGASTALNVQLTNNGNATLEFETASGMWGGTIFPTTALNKTFEDDDITGWSGSVGENSAIYGNTTNSYGYLSDKTWVFNSNGTTAVQYLISPKLRVVTGDNLAFWYKQFNPSSESFEVRISTTDTGIASFTTTLATIGPLANQDWTNYSASLETYAGSDIYVMFYYPRTDGYELGYVMIDDITGPMMVAAPTDWLSCTPVGFPDLETLAPSASRMLTLSLDATTLLVGTYTAETWMFSNGLVSPYKLYVTLNVTQPVAPDAPVVSGIETNSGGITIAWDEVDNAVRYHVSGSDNPYTGYTPIETVTTEYIEITDAEIASFGLTARGFFKVTADSESSRSNKTALNVRSKSSSPLLPNFKRMQKTRTLKALQ